MLPVYESLLGEESTIGNQHELRALIKTLSTRWTDLLRKSDELASTYDAQYRAWSFFDSELSSFRDQILSQLEHDVRSTVALDVSKLLDLNRINACLNDMKVSEGDEANALHSIARFKVLEENMNKHSTYFNRLQKQFTDLKQYTSADGQRTLQEEQRSLEARWQQLNRLLTDKVSRTMRRLTKSDVITTNLYVF